MAITGFPKIKKKLPFQTEDEKIHPVNCTDLREPYLDKGNFKTELQGKIFLNATNQPESKLSTITSFAEAFLCDLDPLIQQKSSLFWQLQVILKKSKDTFLQISKWRTKLSGRGIKSSDIISGIRMTPIPFSSILSLFFLFFLFWRHKLKISIKNVCVLAVYMVLQSHTNLNVLGKEWDIFLSLLCFGRNSLKHDTCRLPKPAVPWSGCLW